MNDMETRDPLRDSEQHLWLGPEASRPFKHGLTFNFPAVSITEEHEQDRRVWPRIWYSHFFRGAQDYRSHGVLWGPSRMSKKWDHRMGGTAFRWCWMVARSCPASVALRRRPGPRVLGASKIFRLARHCAAVHLRMDIFVMPAKFLRKLDYIAL